MRAHVKRLDRFVPQKGSLGARALGAGGWNLFLSINQTLLRLVSNLIMTRLLLPEAFGMMAMAATVLTALTLFTDIGINRSIMREIDGADTRFLRVAWVVKILRSLVVAGGVLVAALVLWLLPDGTFPAESVYAQPQMPGLIALIALSPLLLGFASTSRELTIRRLENRRFVVFSFVAQICTVLAMVGFAQISPTVWALMAGMLVNNLMVCCFTHLVLPGPRMAFEWDPEIAERLWHFGKWLIGSSVLTFVARNADKLLLGGFLGAGLFGIYVISQIWIEAGKTLITRLSEGVAFPVVAEIMRTRPHELPRLYRKVQTAVDLFCVSGFLGALILGPLLVDLLYTSDYSLAGRYLQLMSPSFLMMRYESLRSLILNAGNSRAAINPGTTCPQ